MRLAEALAKRKVLANSLGRDYAARGLDVLTYEVTEGVETDSNSRAQAEAFLTEIAEAATAIAELSESINLTNNAVYVTYDGKTMSLMVAICQRDALAREIAALSAVIDSVETATNRGSARRYSRLSKDDVRINPVISLANLRARLDSRQAALRRVDAGSTNQLQDFERRPDSCVAARCRQSFGQTV